MMSTTTRTERPVIRAICYNAQEMEETVLLHPREAIPFLTERTDRITWIHVHGLSNEAVLRELGMIFNVHPVALEDVMQAGHRPTTAEYEAHRMVIARSMERGEDGSLGSRQVSLFLGERSLLTYSETPHDHFEPTRDRLRRGRGMLRRLGPDHLMYALLDSTIDHFFPLMETMGEELEDLESEMLRAPSPATLHRVYRIKSELLAVRRVIWPLRDVVNALLRDDSGLLRADTVIHLRDCYDHAIQIIEMVETGRELSASLLDVYMSTLGHRTNEVMKILTVVTTVFVPLTFIAGVYGMNFDPHASPFNMPELRWRYGYVLVLLVMAVTAVSMLYLVRRIGWLSTSNTPPVLQPAQPLPRESFSPIIPAHHAPPAGAHPAPASGP